MQQLLQKTLWLIAFLGLSAGAWAQTPFTASSLTITENFNSLALTGTSSSVPTGFTFVETGANANTVYTAGTGSGTAGDTYSFGAASNTDRAFGGIRSGNLVPIIGASFVNNTGSTITALTISYTGEQWRLGTTGRADRLDFQYSTNATSLTVGTYTDVDGLDFSSPITGTVGALDGNLAANRTSVSATIANLSVAPGATIYIRFNDFDASGADDGLAIDDLTIAATTNAPTGPSLTAAPTSLAGFNTSEGTASAAQTYTITSNSLTAGISISATTGIELSSDNSAFTPTLSLPQATTSAVVFARLTSAAPVGPFSGTISNGSGSLSANVAVSGTVSATVAPGTPIIAVNPSALSGFNTTQGTASASQTFTVSGSSLSNDITLTASTNVQISLSSNSGFSGSLTLPQTNSAVSPTPIFVQLTNTAPVGAFSGNVIAMATGASSQTVTISGTVSATVSGITLISSIQGTGTSAALTGTRTIEGIVTRAFPGATALAGFYVQEEDADSDGNPLTSEGIFVYDPSNLFTGNVGDKVRVAGNVTEFTSTGVTLTEITPTSVLNLGANTLPTLTPITFPVANVSDLERYEGMLVTASASSGSLVVTEYFELGRYGSVVLSSGGLNNVAGTDDRLDQYTQFYAPSVSGYAAYLADNARRSIVLDDASGVQNPSNIILGRGGNPLSASNTLRGGDAISSITAILDHRFGDYRLQTATGVNFQPTNPRPATPPAVGGTLRAASFNVLNYFNTFGSTNFTNCGGTSIAGRGADNATEFTRQSDKIVNAIINSGADVMGLNEMQNNGFGNSSAIQDLVTKLNSVAGAGSFTFVNSGCISTDAITVAMIYKPAKVNPLGSSAFLLPGSSSFTATGRGALAQTFQQNSNGAIFTLVANHWKSKGSTGASGSDSDQGDGQGAFNARRTSQATDLKNWLVTKPTGTTDPDYLIVGDLNAYAKEDPLTTLEAGGYTNVVPNTTYSYVFDGQVGALDHGLRSASLQAQITGADKWHVNSDEPNALDYNTNFKTADQITSLYSSEPYRASDHDPVIIGLSLGSTCAGGMMTVKAGAWNDPTVWSCNSVPTATDNVTIKHTVNVPTNYVANVKNVLLDTNGKLSYESNGRLLLNP